MKKTLSVFKFAWGLARAKIENVEMLVADPGLINGIKKYDNLMRVDVLH